MGWIKDYFTRITVGKPDSKPPKQKKSVKPKPSKVPKIKPKKPISKPKPSRPSGTFAKTPKVIPKDRSLARINQFQQREIASLHTHIGKLTQTVNTQSEQINKITNFIMDNFKNANLKDFNINPKPSRPSEPSGTFAKPSKPSEKAEGSPKGKYKELIDVLKEEDITYKDIGIKLGFSTERAYSLVSEAISSGIKIKKVQDPHTKKTKLRVIE